MNRSCLHSASAVQIYRSARTRNIAIKIRYDNLKYRDKNPNYDNRNSTSCNLCVRWILHCAVEEWPASGYAQQ